MLQGYRDPSSLRAGDIRIMRFVDDKELSFCLTISSGIRRDNMLGILGVVEALSAPQSFDDFSWENHQPGKKGLLNVFEDGRFLVTLENNGFLGVARRTIKKVADIYGELHYVAIYHSSGNNGYHYVEVQDGMILADFEPVLDEAPEAVADFFSDGSPTRLGLIQAVEYRLETMVKTQWLTELADTYIIDYNKRN